MARLLRALSTLERAAAVAAALVVITATVLVARPADTPASGAKAGGSPPGVAVRTEPPPSPAQATPPASVRALQPAASSPPAIEAAASAGVATTTTPTVVRASPSAQGAVVSRVRAGVALPFQATAQGFLRVVTPCQIDGWVSASHAKVDARAADPKEPPKPLEDATLVLDPGHGGAPGARGPTGLTEQEVNLDIVLRLSALLREPRDVDWPTGGVSAGTTYRSPRVVLTRTDDYDAGLAYRAGIANALGADAFLSVHNNAEPDGPSGGPGTETYYQIGSAASKRLAGLAYQEVVRSLAAFRADWMAERDAGAKVRPNARGGNYYALLRNARVPTTLVEAAFISNASEESLLRRDDVRQSIAEALYRALVRYVTTRDPGSGFVEPYRREGGPTGRLPTACQDPI